MRLVPAGSGSRERVAGRHGRLARWFTVGSAAGVLAFPFLPAPLRIVDLALVYAASAGCVALGRHALPRPARLPWTFLLVGQVVLAFANAGQAATAPTLVTVGWLLGVVGNLLALAAALSLIVRRGAADPGGLIDAAIIGFAVGSVLWTVLPHHWDADSGWAQELHLFVVVFALPATLAPLTRFLRRDGRSAGALWWLVWALLLALAGHVVLAVDSRFDVVGRMLFLTSFIAIGRFALHPAAMVLSRAEPSPEPDRLSVGRLLLLSFAVDAIPTLGGLREVFGGRAGGLVLVTQGLILSGLVMARIGLLATQRRRAEEALASLVNHDPLTGLPNRHLLVSGLQDVLGRDGPSALLFCDLDDFKSINDTFGHDTGDQVLVEVARRLRQTVRPPDLVCRLGGDEFVVLLRDATPARAQSVRARIEAAMAEPTATPDRGPIQVSVGVVAAAETRDPEQLLKAADAAMYEVKVTHGRGRATTG